MVATANHNRPVRPMGSCYTTGRGWYPIDHCAGKRRQRTVHYITLMTTCRRRGVSLEGPKPLNESRHPPLVHPDLLTSANSRPVLHPTPISGGLEDATT